MWWYLYDYFITGLLLSEMVKEFENRSAFGKVMGKSRVSSFLTHGVVMILVMLMTLMNVVVVVSSLGVFTVRSSDRPVGPTGLSDQSDEAFTRSDRRPDWSARSRLRSTGRSDQSDRPVGPTGRSDDRTV